MLLARRLLENDPLAECDPSAAEALVRPQAERGDPEARVLLGDIEAQRGLMWSGNRVRTGGDGAGAAVTTGDRGALLGAAAHHLRLALCQGHPVAATMLERLTSEAWPLAPGDGVEVHSLTSKAAAHLNGSIGLIAIGGTVAGRLPVIVDGKVVSLKIENLRPVKHPSAPPDDPVDEVSRAIQHTRSHRGSAPGGGL